MIREDYAEWFARGRAHQKAGRPIDAMVCYRRALKSNQNAVQAQYRLGEALRDIGRDDEARRAWRAGLALSPDHGGMLLCSAELARRASAYDEARDAYSRLLGARPDHPHARVGHALCRIGLGEDAAYAELPLILADGAPYIRWGELARFLSAAPPSAARSALLLQLAATHAGELPPPLLVLAAEALIAAGERDRARDALAQAERLIQTIDDPEVVRRLALAAVRIGPSGVWTERYAVYCKALFASTAPVLWPRRTAGSALRVAYLVTPGARLDIGGVALDAEDYLRTIVAGHRRERIAAAVYVVGDAPLRDATALLSAGIPVAGLGANPGPALARTIAEADLDALIDLVGVNAPLGPLLAQRPARTLWTYPELAGANVAPLITHALPAPEAGDEEMLARHQRSIEAVLLETCAAAPWFADASAHSAAELGATWRAAVAAHQGGDGDAAIAGYRVLLAEQPGYAPAQHLLGVLLRDRGQRREAGVALAAAVAAAPAYAEPRVALANLLTEDGLTGEAIKLCKEGLGLSPGEVTLWRALGLARLAQRKGGAARRAFERALQIEPAHATTHYNHGVALQMLRRHGAALRAYQRALALDPELFAADFNIGVIFREQGRSDVAIKAFEQVLSREPGHVPAHKALAETLLAARRLDDWFRAFDRFEAACPDALPMAVLALEACQYRADFAALDRYLDRLRQDAFKASNETELADCLEELLFLLLYFDVDSDAHFGLYKTYDTVAPRVYGGPLALPDERRPGRVRIGYLSGDLRNHVMGKMMWSALEHHDRERFELFFYSISTVSDKWTERYRGLADHFEVIAQLSERQAAERIAADELDILVDLATNTHGAKPGILALKPARVLITHVASAGVVGLSTVDFKLTDACADLPENQPFQLETLLPMEGCVYPYRHVAPAVEHPFHRDRLGITPDAIVIGAFVNPLKLSRRCLTLWREVLDRVPNAVLAISPLSPELRAVYGRLLSAVGIANDRVRVLPQGRNDAENQARYGLVDFTLDPMPYGGANGTLEALDMNVPVVTLVGRKHSERCGYSMLTNLGATQTIAASGSQYVEIAVRLATDPAFMAEVRAAIRAGLERSPLTDMVAHARHLERAYLQALEQRYPAALAASNG
ncbi:MAG TPA: tetratricopeptide repeat protein [Casimicrobiaceae bacterium]|nr:tetratricopeptide repeat protein [Casimicrobiaceae bacterium]